MDTRKELIQLKEETGMSWKKLSEYFGIPYRTLQDWYMGKRKMPEYLLRLMIYKSEIEKLCQKQKEQKDNIINECKIR
ncbi:MAG: transcriptional regulator [Lachnospiraceae bacterium]|nr:transcriptional regulator [Lachnospiraceae bacterium]